MGKGRTIAGIIFENYIKGRKKSLWISVSNDLKYDAERDLRDIGATKIEVHRLNKVIIIINTLFNKMLMVYCLNFLHWFKFSPLFFN